MLRMQTQRIELLNRLSEHGWRVAGEEENLEWWADEMWQLESVWSPVGSRAYITLLVDPMVGPNRRKGEAVWAAMASLTKPLSRVSAGGEFTLSFGQGWKERLPEFFEHLAILRRQNSSSRIA
jgi:hypothetical protein